MIRQRVFRPVLVVAILQWGDRLFGVQSAHAGYHHVEYVPLHHSMADISSAKSFCSHVYQDLTNLWVNRSSLKQEIKTKVKSLLESAIQEDGSPSTSQSGSKTRNNFRLGFRKSPKPTFLEKTAIAANVASKTASKVATAALRTDVTRAEEEDDDDDLYRSYGAAEFSQFNNSPVSTTMVSQDARENSIMLARLKTKKQQRSSSGSANGASEKAKKTGTEEGEADSAGLMGLTDPLIPQKVWDRLTGKEFPENMQLLNGLAETGFKLASNDDSNEWIAWNKVSSTFHDSLEDGEVNVWTGHALRRNSGESFYGTAAPFIKTRSIVPMAPLELIELMLDSSRVSTYNKLSVGRLDLWRAPDERTKIVQNTNKSPLAKKPFRSTTLLHACPVPDASGSRAGDDTPWLLLSRAIGPQPDDPNVGTSDILLGVNLVQPLGDGRSVLTAITHVYSSAIPSMLAERVGVSSAKNFVKDLRALVVPAAPR